MNSIAMLKKIIIGDIFFYRCKNNSHVLWWFVLRDGIKSCPHENEINKLYVVDCCSVILFQTKPNIYLLAIILCIGPD